MFYKQLRFFDCSEVSALWLDMSRIARGVFALKKEYTEFQGRFGVNSNAKCD
jgi:hypothetical protein